MSATATVLPGGIDPLEHYQDPPPALRPQAILEIRQPGQARRQLGRGSLLLMAIRRRRIDPRKIDRLAGPNTE